MNEYIKQHHLNPDEIKIELHESDRPEDAYRREGHHPGHFHTPTIHEIAILLPDREFPNMKRSLVCQVQEPFPDQNHLQFISDGHRSYEPLAYVLLFPFDTDGYQCEMKSKAPKHKQVSVSAYIHDITLCKEKMKQIYYTMLDICFRNGCVIIKKELRVRLLDIFIENKTDSEPTLERI